MRFAPHLTLCALAAGAFAGCSDERLPPDGDATSPPAEAAARPAEAAARPADAADVDAERDALAAPNAIAPLPPVTVANPLKVPAGAGVINVVNFGAKPDGVTDSTKAIQAAIVAALNAKDRYGAPPFVYFPKGTYAVSDTLAGRVGTGGFSDGWRAGLILIGEDRFSTTLRLKDAAPGFGDPAAPKPMIKTGSEQHPSDTAPNPSGGGNQAFRHSVMNLTVSTGRSNAGAVGIDYLTNNRGAIENVFVKSEDGLGYAGILMTRHWPGPGLVKRVAVEGFDYGIKVGHYDYSMTFEHVKVSQQKKAGVYNETNVLTLRNFYSDNAVPALVSAGAGGHLVVLGADLRNGASSAAAIRSGAKSYLRGVQSQGYGRALEDLSGRGKHVAAGAIAEYVSHEPARLFGAAPAALNLPVEEAPEYYNADPAAWANAASFGATPDEHGDDDADAIQRAIDSGKPLVMLPVGNYRVGKPVLLRGGVRKVMGLSAAVGRRPGYAGPIFRYVGGAAQAVVLEHMGIHGAVEHASSKDLSMRHVDVDGYTNTPAGTGKIFVDDMIGKVFVRHPQRGWFRQLNSEFGTEPLLRNHGGTLWVLGYKTEDPLVALEAKNGARTEIWGGFFYPLGTKPAVPLVVLENSKTNLSYRIAGPQLWTIQARETSGGVTKELHASTVPDWNNLPLFTGAP